MDLDDDDAFDVDDILELVNLAAYLEGKAKRRLFPWNRFQRYSDTLIRLIYYLAEDPNGSAVADAAEDISQTLIEPSSYRGSATILTHPRFRGRRRRGPSRGGSGPNDAA